MPIATGIATSETTSTSRPVTQRGPSIDSPEDPVRRRREHEARSDSAREPLQLLPFLAPRAAVPDRPTTRWRRGGRADEGKHHEVTDRRGSDRRAVDPERVRARRGSSPRSPGANVKQSAPSVGAGQAQSDEEPTIARVQLPGRDRAREQERDRGHVEAPDPLGEPRDDVRRRGGAAPSTYSPYCGVGVAEVPDGRSRSAAARRSHPIGFDGTRDAIRTPADRTPKPRFATPPLNPAPACQEAGCQSPGITKNRSGDDHRRDGERQQIVHASRPPFAVIGHCLHPPG